MEQAGEVEGKKRPSTRDGLLCLLARSEQPENDYKDQYSGDQSAAKFPGGRTS
jgi:hypothetical protein